jgi:hypothetical protein
MADRQQIAKGRGIAPIPDLQIGIQRKRQGRGKDRNTETRRRDTKRKKLTRKQAEKQTGKKKA